MIHRKKSDVEIIDVGKAFGMPEGSMNIQWMISKNVGDDRYQHNFAVRRYILKPVEISAIPYHNHTYVQALTVIKGKVHCETPEGVVIANAGDSVYFYSNEQHKAVPVGDETVEILCVIDCPDDGENCLPQIPQNVTTD